MSASERLLIEEELAECRAEVDRLAAILGYDKDSAPCLGDMVDAVKAAMTELQAARAFIVRARSLAMDMYDVGHCPICDGDCAENHTEDCTFARSEEALNAYVKVVQK